MYVAMSTDSTLRKKTKLHGVSQCDDPGCGHSHGPSTNAVSSDSSNIDAPSNASSSSNDRVVGQATIPRPLSWKLQRIFGVDGSNQQFLSAIILAIVSYFIVRVGFEIFHHHTVNALGRSTSPVTTNLIGIVVHGRCTKSPHQDKFETVFDRQPVKGLLYDVVFHFTPNGQQCIFEAWSVHCKVPAQLPTNCTYDDDSLLLVNPCAQTCGNEIGDRHESRHLCSHKNNVQECWSEERGIPNRSWWQPSHSARKRYTKINFIHEKKNNGQPVVSRSIIEQYNYDDPNEALRLCYRAWKGPSIPSQVKEVAEKGGEEDIAIIDTHLSCPFLS